MEIKTNNYQVKFNKGQSTICEENLQAAQRHAEEIADTQGLTVISVTEQAQDNGRYGFGFCHYCGMDANNFGFFNEPVCRECS